MTDTPQGPLYSYKGGEPEPLPYHVRLPDGSTRTDFSVITDKELEAAGYTGPYTYPKINEDTHYKTATWDASAKSWTLTELPEKFLWERVRVKRDNALADTDYTQIPDAPLTTDQVAVYKKYRQELRDLPSKITDVKATCGSNISDIFYKNCPSDPDLTDGKYVIPGE